MRIERAVNNPIISPLQVKPSTDDMVVLSAFNAAATETKEGILLLIRVAEAPKQTEREIRVPIAKNDNVIIKSFRRDDPLLIAGDPRGIVYADEIYLTSLSHFRVARSTDGFNFKIDDKPSIFPTEYYESYGIEDPRITKIGDTYYINYTAVSHFGVTVALITTKDFKCFTKHGVILPPENKNVAIFPEKINGKYMMLHRPSTTGLGNQHIWVGSSPDMLHFGDHKPVFSKRPHSWDNVRVGAGAVPIKTSEGWLEIYHGVNSKLGYCLGAILLDLNEPWRVLARSKYPFLIPETEYERNGFYNNVVFTCGALTFYDNGRHVVNVYYGAADQHTCRADIFCDDILASLSTDDISEVMENTTEINIMG